ncbi:MAG: hypothetical protein ACKV2Q_24750 [Planctomycetaceae bacterium]
MTLGLQRLADWFSNWRFVESHAPRMRRCTLITRGDALLIGNRLFLIKDISDLGWSEKWQCVAVKVRCHPDWVMTDTTESDWLTYVARLPKERP